MKPTRIHHLFDQRVQEDPDHPFLYLKQGQITLGELASSVDALEAELRQSDVRLGDRVLVVAENCPEHVALILACSRVGAWVCGVNARMSASELVSQPPTASTSMYRNVSPSANFNRPVRLRFESLCS